MTDKDNFFAVIMAGGGGTRLWPLSRRKTPKQMVNFTGRNNLFRMSIDRLQGLFAHDHIFVVTVAEQVEQLRKLVPEIPEENYLIEPFPKGTASVVGYAAAYLNHHHPESIMAVLTADHFIQNINEFHYLLKSARSIAEKHFLVTLGIQPTYPATGFGYIQHGEPMTEVEGVNAFHVKKFKEKPDLELARQFMERGDHDWNSGMFIWKTDVILREFEQQMPALYEILVRLQEAMTKELLSDIITEEWEKIKAETIDYGIMEHARNVVVVPAARLGWNDVGSWDSLFEVITSHENGNISIGNEHLNFDTRNSLVYSQTPGKLIVTIGLDNIIVVETENSILVCTREKAQDVKAVVKYLTDRGMTDYL